MLLRRLSTTRTAKYRTAEGAKRSSHRVRMEGRRMKRSVIEHSKGERTDIRIGWASGTKGGAVFCLGTNAFCLQQTLAADVAKKHLRVLPGKKNHRKVTRGLEATFVRNRDGVL